MFQFKFSIITVVKNDVKNLEKTIKRAVTMFAKDVKLRKFPRNKNSF